MTALAQPMAARFKESGTFPELELVGMADGSLVFTEPATDLGGQPGARIYLIGDLLSAVQKNLGWDNFAEVQRKFEAMVTQSCWGVLALVTGRRRAHTLSSLRECAELLLPCWESLDTLRYVDGPNQPVSFSNLIENRFAGLLAMWLNQATGDTRKNLMAALKSLEDASAETRLSQAVHRLTQLASTNQRVRHKEMLTDAHVIKRRLQEIPMDERGH